MKTDNVALRDEGTYLADIVTDGYFVYDVSKDTLRRVMLFAAYKKLNSEDKTDKEIAELFSISVSKLRQAIAEGDQVVNGFISSFK